MVAFSLFLTLDGAGETRRAVRLALSVFEYPLDGMADQISGIGKS